MTSSDRIALAGVVVTAVGVIAGWLALPMFQGSGKAAATADSQPPVSSTTSRADLVATPQKVNLTPSVPDITIEEFKFRFVRCDISADGAVCNVTIEHTSTKNEFVQVQCLHTGDTVIVDEEGVTHDFGDCAIAGSRFEAEPFEYLVPGVPYRLVAQFTDAKVSRGPLRLVQFTLERADEKEMTVRFRNVPVTLAR